MLILIDLLNRLQSIFEYKYTTKDAFYKKLFTAKGIESCKLVKTLDDSNEPFSIFDLLKINDIKELDIAHLRKSKDNAPSLSVPIGKYENAQVATVDLTAYANGLIVSNDSYEVKNVINTFLLSLATLYSPNELQFYMVELESSHIELQKLPHFKKSLMKCDEKSVKEYISHIENEIVRRKDIFKHNKVSSIYQYNQLQQLQANYEVLPHIVIAINDIGKLKTEQPEYFHQMVELSKEAGVLGIHYVFGTDNYFGLVDESLYSVTGFNLVSANNDSPAKLVFNGIQDENLRFYLQTSSLQSPQLLTVACSNNLICGKSGVSDTNEVTSSINCYESQQALIIKEIIKFDTSNYHDICTCGSSVICN